MTDNNNTATDRPEDRFETVTISEALGMPAYGNRIYKDGSMVGREMSFVDYGTKFLARDYVQGKGDRLEVIPAEERILGLLSRDTPAATMGGVYRHFLNWAHHLGQDPKDRDPNATPQNLMLVLSGPGIGKTHLPKVMAKAFGYDHELIGSGEAGGDIDELVIAHEFRGQSAGSIFEKVNTKMRTEPDSLAVRLMVQDLKEAELIKEVVLVTGETIYELDEAKIMQVREDGKERTDEQKALQEQQIKLVGLAAAKANIIDGDESKGIGVQKVNGRLLNKLLKVKQQYDRSGHAEPVIITLDEFNRFKSFGKKLQNFWEVVGGASPEPVTLVDAAGVPHVFTSDMLRYVFVYMTGNDPKKVPSARELDHSMLDRIGENRTFRLDDFSPADWQHRLEQQLIGIGIDAHWRCGGENGGYWDANRGEFTKHLLAKREQGLTGQEKLQVTTMQKQMLENWDDVHQGTKQIAEFLSNWAKTYQSPKHSAELREMTSVPSITPRLLNHLINDLRESKVGISSIEANLRAKETGKPIKQERLDASNLGTKITKAIKDLIDKTHTKKGSKVREDLYNEMFKSGIITREQHASAGYDSSELQSMTSDNLVENLLNTDPHKFYDKELLPLQIAVADAIRQRFPDQREKDTSSLISIEELKAAMKAAAEAEAELIANGADGKMPKAFQHVLLPHLSMTEKGVKVAFKSSVICDSMLRLEQLPEAEREKIVKGLNAQSKRPDSLATTSEFLLGLALTEQTTQQTNTLFNSEFGKILEATYTEAMITINQEGLKNPKDEKDKETKTKFLEKARETLKQRHKQLAPDYAGTVQREPHLEQTALIGEGIHPSGLSASVLSSIGYKAGAEGAQGEYFKDTLSVIRFSRPDAELAGGHYNELLVVGFGEVSQEMKDFLKHKRNITYVQAGSENAQEAIAGALKSIVGQARANQKAKDGNNAAINESSGGGLLFYLQVMLGSRTPDSTEFRAEHTEEPGADDNTLYDTRLNALARHMVDANNLTSKHNKLGHITRLSWQEIVDHKDAGQPSRAVA